LLRCIKKKKISSKTFGYIKKKVLVWNTEVSSHGSVFLYTISFSLVAQFIKQNITMWNKLNISLLCLVQISAHTGAYPLKNPLRCKIPSLKIVPTILKMLLPRLLQWSTSQSPSLLGPFFKLLHHWLKCSSMCKYVIWIWVLWVMSCVILVYAIRKSMLFWFWRQKKISG